MRIGSVCGAGNASAERKRQEMKRSAVTGCKHPVPFLFERSERVQRGAAYRPPERPGGRASGLRAARGALQGSGREPRARCSAKFILCYNVRLLLTSLLPSRPHNGGTTAGQGKVAVMDYRMLYEKLVAEAEGNGLGGEFVDWGISISKWRADPVAVALHGWLLENESEGMAAKPEWQIDREMGIVEMASSRRREDVVASWRRSPGAAARENGDFLVTLGLSNAARSAANEAMIAEIPEIAFF